MNRALWFVREAQSWHGTRQVDPFGTKMEAQTRYTSLWWWAGGFCWWRLAVDVAKCRKDIKKIVFSGSVLQWQSFLPTQLFPTWFSKNFFFSPKIQKCHVNILCTGFFSGSPSCVYVFKLSCFSLLLPFFFSWKVLRCLPPCSVGAKEEGHRFLSYFFLLFSKVSPKHTFWQKNNI